MRSISSGRERVEALRASILPAAADPFDRTGRGLARKDPERYRKHPATKLLTTINSHIQELIPRDPEAAEFRQGNTLAADNRYWFRAKFHERYRLFFRFSTKEKVIIYAWVNDRWIVRKAGAKTDPYRVFKAMLESGDSPQSVLELLARASELDA